MDIDLTLQWFTGETAGEDATRRVREMLQETATTPFGDWFEYLIGPPMMDLTAAPYGGARYSIEARMDGRTFSRFHLDAGIGDVVMQPLETVECRDWLAFAGIERSRVRMIAREQQFAEKVHAYTLPRSSTNSRVKDLVDMALLIGDNQLGRRRTLDALRLTFERRGTHRLPATLEPPPAEWVAPFNALAEECGLQSEMEEVFKTIRAFLEEIVSLLAKSPVTRSRRV